MTMDYQALAVQLVKSAVSQGADAAEVQLTSGRSLNIAVRNGDVETVQEAATQGVTFRVFVQGRMASSNSNSLEDGSLKQALARAVEFAKVTTADPNNVLPADPRVTSVDGLYDPSIPSVPMEQKIELARALEQMAMKDPRITRSSGARYGESDVEYVLANSHGLAKRYKASSCGYGVSVIAEKGEQRSPGAQSCNRRFFADLKPAGEIAADAIRRACEMLDPRPVKTQRAPVVFHADVAGMLLNGILGAIDGERVAQGASFLGAKLNQRIASELVTLIDDGTVAKGMGSKPFDAEGVPTAKRTVVEQGVLRAFLYNTGVAKRVNAVSTGNAVRAGAGTMGIGAHNFSMRAGTDTLDALVKATKVGLLLKSLTGYGINPANGNFSGGAEGLWIEDGKIAFPVKGLTVAGTAAEMFAAIDMVADDLDLNRGIAAPSLRIASLQIGGE
jgi:PmbA protein